MADFKAHKIKKTLDPKRIVCISDAREQRPVNLHPMQSIRGTLTTGDYSVRNLENYVAVERKSLSDLIGCIGRERKRFEKEVMRLLAYPVRALVVEGSWAQIEMKQYRGEVHPNAVIGSLLSWVAQGLPVLMVDNHEAAGRYIARILFTAARRRWEENYDFMQATILEPGEELQISCRKIS